MQQMPFTILMPPLGRVHTNAVQLPGAQDESRWALVATGPWETRREDEKGRVTTGTWPLHPHSHSGLTRDPSVSLPTPGNALVTRIK